MTIKERIIKISDEILSTLLEYKKSNPDFTFSLRSRDSVQSQEIRLGKGQWFQGSDYIFVPLFRKGDSARKIKTLGFVITFNDDGTINNNYLEVSFRGGSETRNEQQFHKELANKLSIDLNEHNFGTTGYDNPNNYLENLKDYLNRVRPMALTLIKKYDLEQKFFISEKVFQKNLKRIREVKERLNNDSASTSKRNDLSILANITWNSNDWKSTSEDSSNHAYVKDGNTPGESWNFDFDNKSNDEDFIYGYAQFTKNPKVKNPPVIVFYSNNKIVGFYGDAEIGEYSIDDRFLNLSGHKELSFVLENKIVDIKAKGFLEDKDRIGQIGFNYIKNGSTIINILDEAIRINPNQSQEIEKLKTWFINNNIIENIRDNKITETMSKTNNLNTILFGPPGTGKTYNTINEALKIVDSGFYNVNKDNRKALNKRFKELLIKKWDETKGQIAFCTFHQSFSYEDFVEGIKPETNEGMVTYDVKNGVFKNICKLAYSNLSTLKVKKEGKLSWDESEFKQASFYKMSLGNSQNSDDLEIYEYCRDHNCIALGFGQGLDYTGLGETEVKEKFEETGQSETDAQQFNYFKNYLKKGNYVLISNGNKYVRALGKVTGDYEYDPNAPIRYNHFRNVEWVFTDENIPIEEIYEVGLSQRTIYKINENKLKPEFFINQGQLHQDIETTEKDYVLIIDEINRGNVSSIFGELITLIETDKRAGKDEELEVILPYSKQPFKVPHNVHIIGTMNTADKSIEALDTALRRRFSFTEMPPKSKLIETESLSGEVRGIVDGVNLKNLLNTINRRIEKLIDKDHKIGHSYFLKVKDKASLVHCFKNEVIPLLEEYFFGDYGKIGLVLGNSFITRDESDDFEFAEFEGYDSDVSEDLKQRSVYKISNSKDWDFNSI